MTYRSEIFQPAECDANCDDPECPYTHAPVLLRDAYATLAAENERLKEMVEEMVEGLERLRKSAAMLQQNSEGCAVNHYGEDFGLFGMPSWLADTATDIEAARALISRAKGAS